MVFLGRREVSLLHSFRHHQIQGKNSMPEHLKQESETAFDREKVVGVVDVG